MSVDARWVRGAAVALSVAAHAFAFHHFASHPLTDSGGAPKQARFSRVTMQFAPPPPPEAEPEPEAAPEPTPVVEAPPPPPKPEPKPKPKPQPKPKPAPPKPKPKAPPQQAPAERAAPVQAPLPVAVPAERADPQLREAYLAHLLAHIERHKKYPKVARRRGIEGRVTVRFQLTAAGEARALHVEGGQRSLRNAAEQAVRSALPLPVPPKGSGVELPMTVEYAMEFRLH